jgi:hypothetical protein
MLKFSIDQKGRSNHNKAARKAFKSERVEEIDKALN